MELGEALRNTENSLVELTPLSSVACGATRWPGFKVFALCAGYAHILARLRSPLQDFCLGKGAKICAVRRHHNPLNPLNLLNPLNPLNPHP